MFPRDPQEPRLIAWLRNPRVLRTLTLTTLWLSIAVTLVAFRSVLLPFALAILLAFLLDPSVARLSGQRPFGRSISRALAVVIIYLGVGVALYLFGRFAIPQVGREVAKLGTESAQIIRDAERISVELIDRAETFSKNNNIPVDRAEFERALRQNLTQAAEGLGHNATRLFTIGRDVLAGLVRVIFGTFLVLMLTAFLSIDSQRIVGFFFTLVPPEHQTSYRTILSGMSSGLAGVVRGQILICLANGILTFIGLWFLGVKFVFVLAAVATIFSLIPIFGSILSTIPIVAIALTDSLPKGVFALLWIVGIHLLEANFLNPKIMGDAAKIHPVVVVFALIVGESTQGLVGALFAVPIAAVLLTVFKFLHRKALEASAEIGTGDLALLPPHAQESARSDVATPVT